MHIRARVAPMERAALASWLTPPQQEVFDRMHVADQRHGLDVVATLRALGVVDREVLVAGLIHDAGKGKTGIWPRVAYSLGQAYGPMVQRAASVVPGWEAALHRLRDHAETSAQMAATAGCTARTVELIRHQDAPLDVDAGRLLKLADEAN
ncbi:MAG: hypothetical protein ABIP77_03100 [Candidatus Limnocylindrales bacterium]